MKEISDRRTLRNHGAYSAYCKICWCPVYVFWIEDRAPDGKCIHGLSDAKDCPEALASVKLAALAKQEEK